MGTAKKIGAGLLGLAISLALLMVVLRFAKKVPVLGTVAGHVDNLVHDGTL